SELDGKFIEVNPRFCDITGFSEEELKTMKAVDIIHTADLQRDGEMLSSLLSGEVQNFIIEKRFVRKDKGIAWVKNSVSLVPNQQGRKLVIRVAEDITAVKLAEKARKESEAKYSILAESMPIMVWTTSGEGEADYFNQTYYTYTGSGPEQNLGKGWGHFLHPDDLEGAVERWNRSVATGTEYYTEFRIRGKNGLYRWVAARAVPLKDKNNRVQKWYGTNADIHDVKALSHELESAHLQLESEKEKFETIFADSSTSMAVLQGPLFVYENANPSYLRLFNNRDLLGRPFLQALPELEGQQFPMQAKKVFETGEPYIEVEAKAYLMRTDQGPLEERYFDQSYTRMLDGTGQPYGVFIHATEVTDRVMARRKYEETAERFRIAVEAANMGTWEVIPQTGVVEWSPRTSELFGVAKEKQLHLSEAVVNVHPDDIDRVNKAIAAATDPNGDGAYEIEYRVVKPDGQSRWLSLLGKSFFADTPEG
ncbi:MAG: PAS domain S-box protein, partial [Proteobacteria bacterium]